MVSETVCVFCRLKPLNEEVNETCIKYENEYTVSTIPPRGCRRNTKEMTFNFTKVFHDNTTQSEIYNDVAYPLVNDLLNKKNGLLFAYGVTGSGKTYTMEGTRDNPGIVTRFIKSLFRRLKFLTRFRIEPDNRNGYTVWNRLDSMEMVLSKKHDFSRRSRNYESREYLSQVEDDPFEVEIIDNCTVFVSMVEIYGNNIRDLLSSKTDNSSNNVRIREDSKNNNYIFNVKEVEVQEPEEAIYWYLEGQKKRKIAQTNLNNQSSRSHCVFNIRLVRLNDEKGDEYKSPDKNRIVPFQNGTIGQRNSTNFVDGLKIGMKSSPPLRHYGNGRDGGKMNFHQADPHVTFNQVSLVDLAGRERAKRTGNTGIQLKEAGDINNSLMELQKVMKMLRQNQRCPRDNQYINYRGNELTKLFKTNFEDGSSVRMILCAQPLPEEYDETLNVLAFAEDAREVVIHNHDNLYTPKVQKVLVKPVLTVKESDPVEEFLSKLEEEMNANLPAVERYRMIQQKELNDDNEMMNNVVVILDCLYKILHYKDQLNTLMNTCEIDDHSDRVDSLNAKLNNNKLEINSLKRRLKEAETKLAERDRELANKDADLTNIIVKKEEKIKELKENARREKEDWEQQRKARKLDDLINNNNSKAITPMASVKTLTKKFEDVSKNNRAMNEMSTRRGPLAPLNTNNRKGFLNRHYRRSKSYGQCFEHKEKNEIPAGTLSKLNIKNRRSSKKLKMEDLKNTDTYILQHQSGTPDQFRVEYHTGNVIPTAGGGVGVCFTNVETIKQHSPYQHTYTRKRQSSVPSDIENHKRSKENY